MTKFQQPILVAVNNRHVHLSEQDSYKLFGDNYKLSIKRPLSFNAFASKETVALEYNGCKIDNVRVVGPYRSYTQVEILESDSYMLYKEKAPSRMSGDISDSFGIDIIGPKGRITLEQGVIVAQSHAHLNNIDTKYFGVRDGDAVRVNINGKTLDDVIVSESPTARTSVHIDVDVARSLGVYDRTIIGMLYFTRRC